MSKEEKILKNNEEILSEKEMNAVAGGVGLAGGLAGGFAGGLASGLPITPLDDTRPMIGLSGDTPSFTEVLKTKAPSGSAPLSSGIIVRP